MFLKVISWSSEQDFRGLTHLIHNPPASSIDRKVNLSIAYFNTKAWSFSSFSPTDLPKLRRSPRMNQGLSVVAQQHLVVHACPGKRVQEAQCPAHPLHKSLTGTAGRKNISNTAWEKVSHHKDGALENGKQRKQVL